MIALEGDMIIDQKCKLIYKIEYESEKNKEAFDEMRETLAQVGVEINVDKENGYLILIKDKEKYKEVRSRGAGRKGNADSYSAIEVLIMMQDMTDKEIYKKINMPVATYYRHKKALFESDFYHTLDPDRIHDIEYLLEIEKDILVRDILF